MAPSPSALYTTTFFLALFITLLVALSLRVLAILPLTRPRIRSDPVRKRQSAHVLIVLGSGGHTHEMFYLLKDLDPSKYTHRTYVVSSGDAFSARRAVEFEAGLEKRWAEGDKKHDVQHQEKRKAHTGPQAYTITTVPRARKIHQPLLTTPVSSLKCLYACFAALLAPPAGPSPLSVTPRSLPDLIVVNGPATAVIVVLASLFLRFFDMRGAQSCGKCRTIYVESFARVKTLSLSGKLLLRVVDRFLVQWEELKGRGGGKAEFCGILV